MAKKGAKNALLQQNRVLEMLMRILHQSKRLKECKRTNRNH
jgi:hypothetical protein